MSPAPVVNRSIDCCVIGASAGGVEALSVLLPALPAAMRLSILIVLHLAPDRPSLLTEIFKSRCAVAVKEAEDKEPVAPGTIYFAPPGYHLLVDHGPQLALSVDDPVNFSRPSIDVLFESASWVYAQRLLGIILTGANADGAAGLAAVHHAGGMTIVEQPETAQVPTMVVAALERGPVDLVLPLEQIAELLRTLGTAAPAQTAVPVKD